jgi:hypothetical protein
LTLACRLTAPLAATVGLGGLQMPMVTSLSLSLNGNAITVSAALFERMVATGVAARDDPSSWARALAAVIKQIPLYSEMHRFIPAMTSMAGTRVCELKVRHHARRFGQSKYGLNRVYKVAIDLVGIKALLTATRHPSSFFAVPALILLLAAAGFGLAGMLAVESLVFFSVALLFASGGLILVLYGVLTELLVSTGDITNLQIAALTQIRTGRFFR